MEKKGVPKNWHRVLFQKTTETLYKKCGQKSAKSTCIALGGVQKIGLSNPAIITAVARLFIGQNNFFGSLGQFR